jgi:hypothetical protein
MNKPTTLFHGTNRKFNVGDLILPAIEHGGTINYSTEYLKQLKDFAHATIHITEAERYAANAVLKNGGTANVYLVQPFDPATMFHDDDAPYPDWHDDSVDGWSSGAFRTKDGFVVIAIIKEGEKEMKLEDPAITAMHMQLTTNNNNERATAMKAMKSTEVTPEEMNEMFTPQEEGNKLKPADEMSAFEIINAIYQSNDIYGDVHGYTTDSVRTVSYWDRYGYYTRTFNQFHITKSDQPIGMWSVIYEVRLIESDTGWIVQSSATACYLADGSIATKFSWKSNNGIAKNSNIPPHRKNFKHILIVSKTPSGVRLIVKDTKTKAIKWGKSVSEQKEFGKLHASEIGYIHSHIIDILEEMYSQKDVMPIAEYLPKVDASYRHSYAEKIQYNQLHDFSARNLYWIGGKTSLVDVLNRAYGKSGQDGLTRNAFGGMKKFNYFQELEAAVVLVRMFKSFPREFFDNVDISWVVTDTEKGRTWVQTDADRQKEQKWDEYFNYKTKKYEVDAIVKTSTEEINYFNKFFKTFGVRNSTLKWYKGFLEQTLGDTRYHVDLVVDTMVSWKRIPVGRARKAVVAHVKQQKMNPEEIHNFVIAEARKYEQVERKTPNNKLINSFNGKEVLPGVIFVAPKTTRDLVEWGTEQNNCIGTAYTDRVVNKDCYIIGFKDKATNEWIGHARLDTDYRVQELRAKHNQDLESTMDKAIRKWMDKNLTTNTKKGK